MPGLSPPRGGNRFDHYGYWVALVGIVAAVAGRYSQSSGLLVVGIVITAVGIGFGLRAGRAYLKIYVRELIPGGSIAQADPFASRWNPAPTSAFRHARLAYLGEAVWAGGRSKGLRLEISAWGVRLKPTWLTWVLSRKHARWELPWSAVASAEVARLPNMGAAPTPVRFSIRDPSTAFLFFTRTPIELVDAVIEQQPHQ